MALEIRAVQYFYTAVHDRPGEAYRILSALGAEGVNLVAFGAVPMGAAHTQLVLYPKDAERLVAAADRTGLVLTGPQRALMVTGDDRLGALADVHARLGDANVNVFSSSGVTDGRGGFGYLLHLRPEDLAAAERALGV